MSKLKVDEIRSADRSVSSSANITLTDDGNIKIPDGGTIGSASDADAISISSTGIVKYSAVPAFSVVPASDQTSISATTDTLVTFNTAILNNGNHFNTASSGSYPYSFNAPVTGIYLLSIQIYMYYTRLCVARVQINGTTKMNVYSGDMGNADEGSQYANPAYASGSFVYPLTANDKVQIKAYTSDAATIHTSGTNDETTMFSGYLIG